MPGNNSEGVKDSTVSGLLFYSLRWYTSRSNDLLVTNMWILWKDMWIKKKGMPTELISVLSLPVAERREYCVYCWILNKSRHSLLLLHTSAVYLEFSEIIFCQRFPGRSCWIRLLFPPQNELRMKLFQCFWTYLITAWFIFKNTLPFYIT